MHRVRRSRTSPRLRSTSRTICRAEGIGRRIIVATEREDDDAQRAAHERAFGKFVDGAAQGFLEPVEAVGGGEGDDGAIRLDGRRPRNASARRP